MKDTKHELLVVVANQGYTETIMEAARRGRPPAAPCYAKGTGMEGAEKFLGVSLAAEKELVLIVVRHEQKNDVMTAIMEDAGLESRAKAVFFAARHEHGGPAPDRPDRRHRITAHESRSGSQNAVYRRVGGCVSRRGFSAASAARSLFPLQKRLCNFLRAAGQPVHLRQPVKAEVFSSHRNTCRRHGRDRPPFAARAPCRSSVCVPRPCGVSTISISACRTPAHSASAMNRSASASCTFSGQCCVQSYVCTQPAPFSRCESARNCLRPAIPSASKRSFL